MSLWSSLGKGILSMLTGGISSYFGNLGNLLSAGGDTLNNADPAGSLDNYLAKQTGSRLTDAEREANEWTASREDLAYERSKMAYQNQVADMRAAGLNPAMMYGGGAGGGTSVPAPSSSVSPAGGAGLNLGSILSLLLESKMLPAKIANIKADTAEKFAKAASTEQQVDYFDKVKELRAEAEGLQNEMSRSRMKEIDGNIRKLDSEVTKNYADAKSSEERAKLSVQQAILAKAEADNIQYMRPFIQAELSAKTAQEKAQASLLSVEAAYQQGLIDEGAIKAAVRASNASASESEIDARAKAFAADLQDGSLRRRSELIGNWRGQIIYGLHEGISMTVKSALGKF